MQTHGSPGIAGMFAPSNSVFDDLHHFIERGTRDSKFFEALHELWPTGKSILVRELKLRVVQTSGGVVSANLAQEVFGLRLQMFKVGLIW